MVYTLFVAKLSSTPPPLEGKPGMMSVQLPYGAEFRVHQLEVTYFTGLRDRYRNEMHLTNVSHQQDVDRVVMQEITIYRWGRWLSQQCDWWGDPIEPNELQKWVAQWSAELRQLKKSLGMDKTTMDKQRGDDSVSTYLSKLRERANEFGIMREDQLGKALELFNQLRAIITLHLNCDEIERREQHVEIDDVLKWITDIAVPEYEQIDEHFRHHSQKMWIRSM